MRSVRALRSALVSLSLLASIAASAQSTSLAYDAVDPFIGTAGGGNTFPGATLPFGMMQWSPDTNHDAWYSYNDKQIKGFSLTHISGAGCPLYGDFAVLPTSSALTAVPGQEVAAYATAFDHSKEEAHPGFYAVTLANGIRVEITVAERAGIARFIFPEGAASRLLINAGSSANLYAAPSGGDPGSRAAYGNQIELNSDTSFAGASAAGGFCGPESHYKIYVAGRFNKPYKSSALWQDETIFSDKRSVQGKRTGAWLDFGNEREIEYKVGISFVSEEAARNNLDKEIPGWNFEAVHARARTLWSTLLDRLTIEGGNADQRKIFYTGVYHSFLSPNLFSDDDDNYPGFDGKVHALTGSKQKAQYANLSDWDIYRNTVQLQALFEPERSSDMMQSLVNDAVQSGIYPRWPAANDVTYVMGGDSPVIVVASS
jgi:predicted alpha-1,2-mannosidase